MAARYSNEVKAELEIAMDAARTLSNSLSAIKSSGNTSRNMVNQMISEILNRNNNFVGVGVGFEPNAFDGKDAEFSNTIGTDASGRFISYAVRSASGITIEALKGYDKPGIGDWYLKPIASGDESIIDPYPYEINGMKTMITTVVVPIKVGNTNIGVVGIDITLEKLKSITDRIRPYGDGYSFILSNNGVFVTHPKAELVGTNLKELKTLTESQKSELMTSVINSKTNHLEILSAATGLHTSFEYVPIQIGNSKTPWSFGVGVPMETALKDVSDLTYFAVFVGIITLIIISVAVIFIAKSIIKPIVRAMQAAESIAGGELNIDLTTNGKDETARLITAMNTIKTSIKDMSDDVQYLTSAGQQGKLDIRANTDKHKGAYKEIVKGMNTTLDAVIAPLNVAAEYIDRIAKGDIPPKITDEYQGDFNEIKNNLNQCIDSINLLVSDANSLADAAILGDVKKRADIAKHNGDYRKIIQGFNNTLDAIIAPIDEAVNILELMAKGDLSQLMDGEFRGDHAVLKEALNGTIESINELLSQVSETVYQVLTGSSQVADTSQHLSSGAGEQAAAIEQMSSSMMEIASQTKQNAENAANANKLADNSLKSSERGYSEMQQLQVAMHDINESSKSIAKIIKVIDKIAFQTNLLALNAAVEAARAGVHGQGFAVVAEEVRNLARRSADAAKETADLIEGSIKKVEVGNSLSEQTAKVLNEIREQSVIVAGIIRQIAEASNEQATGINQIEIGFSQIDRITQQNTAGAEESASAAEQLAGQAKMLEEMLSTFELINAGTSHAIAAPKSRKALKSHKYSLNS